MNKRKTVPVFHQAQNVSSRDFKRLFSRVLDLCNSLESRISESNHPYPIYEELLRVRFLAQEWGELRTDSLVSDSDDMLFDAFNSISKDLSTVLKNVNNFSFDQGQDAPLIEEIRTHLVDLEKIHAVTYPLEALKRHLVGYEKSMSGLGNTEEQSVKQQALIESLSKKYDDMNNRLGSLVASQVNEYFDSNIANTMDGLKTSLTSFIHDCSNQLAVFKQAEQDIAAVKEQANGVLLDAMEAGLVSSIGRHANEFKTLATTAGKEAEKWLSWGVVLLSSGALAALIFAFVKTIDDDDFKSIGVLQLVVPRVVLTGGLIFAGVWCTRMFKVFRHQQESYRFKRTVLLSLYRIYNTTDDEELRKSMVLEASKTIFSVGMTGLVDAEEESASNRMVELIKLVQTGKI